MAQRILLLSASRYRDSPYLAHALPMLESALEPLLGLKDPKVLFIPYAGVTFSYQQYTQKVQKSIQATGIRLQGIHEVNKPDQALFDADAVLVGGGNTFRLLERLYTLQLIEPLKLRIAEGLIYVGWSAGSNVAGPTICTTNDMPIIEPPTLTALGLVPFQINPHYTESHPFDHHGETRLQRLNEYLALNPEQKVLAMPEGTALRVDGQAAQLLGEPNCYWIRVGGIKTEVKSYQPFNL